MAGLYFEEFFEGQTFEHELRKTLTESDNMMFSTMTLNPQPLHIDRHFAEQTDWGQPLMNSVLTLGLVIGVSVGDTTLGTTIGNLGMSETTFPHPVFQGDTVRTKNVFRRIRRVICGPCTQDLPLPELENQVLSDPVLSLQYNGDMGRMRRILHLLREPGDHVIKMLWARNNVAQVVKDRPHEL